MNSPRELPRDTWTGYLDRVADERRRASVAVVIEWHSQGEEVEAHDVLLESLTYDAHDDAISLVARRPSASGMTVLRHVVSRPRTLEVDSPAGIVPCELRIEGEDGVRTTVIIAPQIAVSA